MLPDDLTPSRRIHYRGRLLHIESELAWLESFARDNGLDRQAGLVLALRGTIKMLRQETRREDPRP